MKSVMQVVRKTSLFLQPQIRTKIMNEGWASYWHENLFLPDDRIKGHEVDFARVNAAVTSLPRVGLNPYALGMRLFYYIEEIADKGKYSLDFQRRFDLDEREKFDQETGKGQEFIFKVRENFCDSMLINTFVDQDFVTKNKLFVAGKKLNPEKMVWQYYVKSRKAQDYRQMVQNSLYHPPYIEVDPEKNSDNELYLVHHFEEKPLVNDFIFNTMMGIEYLWGGSVQLETSEVVPTKPAQGQDVFSGLGSPSQTEDQVPEVQWERVLYTMQDRKLSRKKLL
jgi:stage V sporulation protein R